MRAAVALPFIGLAACGTSEPLPVARIDLTPRLLCEGNMQQPVTASGRRSQSSHGVDGELSFLWQFSNEPVEVVRGAVDEQEIVARFVARTPVKVRLVVTDAEGHSADREALLALTRAPVRCEAGCSEQEICVTAGGNDWCATSEPCVSDEECGCLRCRPADNGTHHCLP